MFGASDVWFLYQNSGPLMLAVMLAGGTYVWRHDIQPRLRSLEQKQESRGDRLQDHEVNARERAVLLENAHDRIDDVEDVYKRLRKRLRALEQKVAAEQHTRDDDPGGG